MFNIYLHKNYKTKEININKTVIIYINKVYFITI